MATTAPARAGLPRWERWLTLIALIAVVVGPIIGATSRLGAWVVPLSCTIGLASLVALVIRTDLLAHRRLRDRIQSRPAIPVMTQVRSLLEARGVPADRDALERVAIRWLETARFLQLKPEHLRSDDHLAREYQESPILGSGIVVNSIWWSMQAQTARGSEWSGPPGSTPYGCAVAPPTCPRCGYDRTGLTESATCPECGTVPVIIRTLGDYLIIASGLNAYPLGPSSPTSCSGSSPSPGSP